jgi:hypothetical protein
MDQAAQEEAGVEVDELLLSVGKHDLPFMLPAGAVLGEEAGPALRVGRDDVAIASPQMTTTRLWGRTARIAASHSWTIAG